MNSVLKLVIILLILLVLFHYKKFRDYTLEYEVEQQELEYLIGNNLYNILNPLVITFIEKGTLKFNVEEYKLFSSITIQKKFNNFITNNYYNRHTDEILLIRSKKKVELELVNPKYLNFFKKNGKSRLSNYILEKEHFSKVKTISLILREYNILYIPRYWLFKFNERDVSIEIFRSNNIFTYCFNIL